MKKDSDLKWSDLKKSLQKSDTEGLINIIQKLYRYSEDNRRYLLARCIDREEAAGVMEEYRDIIKNEFFPKRGYGELRYSVAEKAINDYSEASGDFAGTMELMFFYVENGVEFTSKYGDIDEEFYLKIYGMLEKFCTQLKTPEGNHFMPISGKGFLRAAGKQEEWDVGFGEAIGCVLNENAD
mgnify:CR=1 FL=1